MILTLVDTTGIQPYIFGSNRLQENIGASYLVDQATTAWARQTFAEVKQGNDRVLYTGGGNAVIIFDDPTRAERFENKLTRKALEEAPGLQILVVHHERNDSLPNDLDAAFGRMALLKSQRARSAPLLGLSVTKACRSTGLPATASVIVNGADIAVAPSIYAKLRGVNWTKGKTKTTDLAHNRLKQDLKIESLGLGYFGYNFPRDFEELGATKGEQSYIAIVHADGNGMGDRIRALGDRFRSEANRNDDAYSAEMTSFSSEINEAALEALRKTLLELMGAIKDDGEGGKAIYYPTDRANKAITPEISIRLPRAKSRRNAPQWFLPFRPIVFGGDDVTFVCDGRLGLSLAAAYLRHFEGETRKRNQPLTACAGVAIVKSHYPFAQAYALAEELCKSAKSYRKERMKLDPNTDISCLDWHFATSGLFDGLGDIRKREYTVRSASLNLRPVSLRESTNESRRTWHFIEETTRRFQHSDWYEKRNKLKALREALRDGVAAVEKLKTLFSLKDPMLDENGWYDRRCTLFDAVELADIYLPIDESLPTVETGATS